MVVPDIMSDLSLVPVDYEPDFPDVSLVPVDHDPLHVDSAVHQPSVPPAPVQDPLPQSQPVNPKQQAAMESDQPDFDAPAVGLRTPTNQRSRMDKGYFDGR